jgi:putative flippase GtrA
MKIRFAAFSAVGAIGFVLQLGTLWLLTSRGLHYLAATVAATELAIVLNFFGHERWTWADRPAGAREAMWRFCRFHGTNGAISFVGVALIMPVLIEIGQMHYLLANVLTVGACALANFIAADRVVFRTAPAFLLMLALIASSAPVEAAELRPHTLDAFNRYVRVTESRMDGELQGKAAFLWVDRLPEAERLDTYSRLKRGETVVRRLVTRDAGREIDSPDGLIHHWTGTAFIPGATVERTVGLMQDYEGYHEFYSPNVRESRTISRQGETFKVYLQLFVKKIISVVLNTEYDVRYTHISASRVNVRSYTTKITEVQDPGTAGEKELPVGRDSGFLWRFYNYCSLEERAEGTYVQCESLSLSRAIPAGLGWIVGPFVTSIPRESLEFTLGRMRKALSYSGKQP